MESFISVAAMVMSGALLGLVLLYGKEFAR